MRSVQAEMGRFGYSATLSSRQSAPLKLQGGIRSLIRSFPIACTFILLGCLYCPNLWATLGVSVGSGYGEPELAPVRVGVQKEFGKKWFPSDQWQIGGYWEGSVNHMTSNRRMDPPTHRHVTATALAGVFRLEPQKKILKVWPYFEIGVGASYLSKKEIGGKKLGIHFQFEDRLGMGLRFGEKHQYDFGYKFIHFSNADIGSNNHALNMHMIVLGYWFY